MASGGRPSLSFNFAAMPALDSRITFTRASTATYFNSAGTLTSAAVNEARFDYNPSTLAARGLLIEEARTNLCLDSADLAAGDRGSSTGWYAITRATLSSNVIAAPDGTTTADKIVADSSNNTHFAANRTTVGSTTNTNPITVSGFFKAAELSFSSILITEGSTYSRNAIVFFDLSAGTATVPTVAGGAASASATITPVGNGWYRCTLTVTLGGTDTRVEIRAYPTNSASTATFTGNSVDGVYAWGFQIEAGAFPTSYIPTTTTALTRSADVALVNTLSPWFNATAGTTYFEGVTFDTLTSAFPRAYQFNDGTINSVIKITRNNSSGNARMSVVSGGVAQAAADATTWTLSATTKAALAYATNDFAIVANGGAATTDSSGTVPTVSNLLLGSQVGGASFLNGYLRRIVYYPRRLSNAELQSITS
jgi:hypothetical protein